MFAVFCTLATRTLHVAPLSLLFSIRTVSAVPRLCDQVTLRLVPIDQLTLVLGAVTVTAGATIENALLDAIVGPSSHATRTIALAVVGADTTHEYVPVVEVVFWTDAATRVESAPNEQVLK